MAEDMREKRIRVRLDLIFNEGQIEGMGVDIFDRRSLFDVITKTTGPNATLAFCPDLGDRLTVAEIPIGDKSEDIP